MGSGMTAVQQAIRSRCRPVNKFILFLTRPQKSRPDSGLSERSPDAFGGIQKGPGYRLWDMKSISRPPIATGQEGEDR
jgi:hypothetical protein